MAEQNAYGGFWIRFLAYLVDSVVFFTLLVALAAGAAFLGDLGALVITAAVLVGPLLYWGLMQASARQATFGKALLGMKVTDSSGNRMSLLRSLGRELAKYVSAIPLGLGFLLAAFTGRKQALHDMIASTTVVRESPGHVLVGLIVGLFGWLAPAALAMFVGGALLAVMLGTMGTGVFPQAMTDSPKKVAVQSAPAQPAQPSPAPAVAPAPAVPPAPSAAPASVEATKSSTAAPKVRVAAASPRETKGAPGSVPPASAREPGVVLPGPIQARTIDLPAPLAAAAARPGPKYNDVMSGVMTGDSAAVNELLALGRWADKPDSNGITPLTAAVKRGDRANAELLLKAGADAYPALAVARERRDTAMTSLLERYRATSKRP